MLLALAFHSSKETSLSVRVIGNIGESSLVLLTVEDELLDAVA